MANICSVFATIKCDSPQSIVRLHHRLKQMVDKAKSENIGVWFSSDRYWFDSELSITDNGDLTINSWVKWGLDRLEAKAFVDFITNTKDIIVNSIVIDYEEIGNLEYGKYVYDGVKLYDHCVPKDKIPNDDETDCMFDTLEKLLDQSPEITEVK